MLLKINWKQKVRKKGGGKLKFVPRAPVIRSRESEKDRQYNDQKKKDKQ